MPKLVLPFIIIGSLCAIAPAFSSMPCMGPGHGGLLIHGGGGESELFMQRAIELCGGRAVRVVTVPYALGSPDVEGRAESEKYWVSSGAATARVVDLSDEAGSIAAIGTADYVFFGGGDQKELMKWMAAAPAVMAAIRKRHEEGALIGGMSAGAAAMSRLMIKGGDTADLTGLHEGGTALGEGLGFWPEVITDQHFVKRQRWARLVSAVLDHPRHPGIAIDEDTAILVNGNTFEVLGKGTVVVIDARRAKIRPTAKGEAQSANDVRMSVLRAGDRFNWKESE